MPDGLYATAGTGAVTFINHFTVHAAPEDFERTFTQSCAFMMEQDGFLGNTLLRHADNEHQYVNIALWREARLFRRAVQHPSFDPHRNALRALSTSEPGLYRPRWSFEPATTQAHPNGQ